MSAQTAAASVINLTEDFFGVAASQLISSMALGSKPQRKDAFASIKVMAKAAGLLTSKDKILSIGFSTNVSGTRLITIVLEAPPATIPQITVQKIIENVLDQGLRTSTWRDSYPAAYEALMDYRSDMILTALEAVK